MGLNTKADNLQILNLPGGCKYKTNNMTTDNYL